MDTIGLDDPCILFALRRESHFFRKEFRPYQAFPGAPCWAHFCGPPWLNVLILETGVGETAVAGVLDWLFAIPTWNGLPYRPKVVLFAGFAGALDPALHVADLVLADEVIDAEGKRWRTTWPGELPAGRWTPTLHRGALLTTSSVAATAAEKRGLAERHRAIAVDMESASAAERCTRAGVPFGCVRVISDEAGRAISPALVSLLAAGQVSPLKLTRALVRNPSLLGELLRLGRDTQHAARQLGLALGELLTLTLPWSGEEA